jgi:tetratricopeptide (TPR) repeat protein
VKPDGNTTGTLIRIYVLGPLTIEWSQEVMPFPKERLVGRGAAPALGLIKALISQPHRFALRDWLMEQFWPNTQRSRAEERLDDVASGLRSLLRPPGSQAKILQYIHGSNGKGCGYQLESYPLIWVDADALSWYVEQAARCERFGQDALSLWEQAFQLASRGDFLPEELYSDWATSRRESVVGQYRQCVHRLTALLREGGATEQAVLRLRTYWQAHPADEDALRPLLELLGEQERYQEAEDYYQQCVVALDQLESGRQPDQRTKDILEFLHVKQIRRERPAAPTVRIVESTTLSPPGTPLSAGSQHGFSLLRNSLGEHHHMPLFHSAPQLSAVLSQVWNVPYQRNPFFTGREEVLMRLHELLNKEQAPVAVSQQALCGLGGVGKTQVALEYAYRYCHEYQAIFWVKADTRENLVSDFLALASTLRLPERDAPDWTITLTAIKQWLREKAGWLLIFDNADDLALVRDFLPVGHWGHILLTTRAQAAGRLAHRIEIDEMDLEIGTLFLLRRIGAIDPDGSLEEASSGERDLAQEIVQQLGGLPLALDQAGAYIEETASSLQEYLLLYREERSALLKRRGGLVTDHPEPVATTWSLSFQQIEDMDRTAADVLRLCAFLDPDAIAEEIFTQGAAQVYPSFTSLAANALSFHQAVETLRKFSLLRRNPETKVLTLHRLVQASIQDSMDQATLHIWIERAIGALEKTFPSEITVPLWPQCQRLLPHIQMCLHLSDVYQVTSLEAATIFNQAGYFLRERALYHEAEQLYQRALSIREQVLGHEHPEAAQVLYNLARLYYDLGQYDLCEKFHLQALKIRERTLPANHLSLALSLNSLAFLYYIQNRNYAEAEHLYQRALPIFDAALGMNHPKTAHCLSNLALLYTSQGKGAEAERLLLHVKALRESQLGAIHLDTARSLQNLAWFYIDQRKQERYQEAKQLLEQSLTIRETLLGSEHPQIAMSLHHLALLCEVQEDYAGAKQCYQQVLAIRRKMMGDDNPKVLMTEASYAKLLRKMGLNEEAAQLEEHVQAVQSKQKG